MNNRRYDYIIAGAGLSGLSLACRIIRNPQLSDKKILVVDQSLEVHDEKTWSFWHKGNPPFEEFIYKSWKQVRVVFDNEPLLQPLETYTYRSIRSRHFRNTILEKLESCDNVDLLEMPIQDLSGSKDEAVLQTPDHSYHADYIFQSCFTPPEIARDKVWYPLIQHFLGWEIETNKNVFDPSTVTLMDFDPEFTSGIAFLYILPESPHKALLEYTVFSKSAEPKEFYEEKLAIYIHNRFNLRPLDYRIHHTEYGEIPMQDHPYVPWYAPRILNMGTAGGLTKPSTGYTFLRIQRHVDAIIKALIQNEKPAPPYRSPLRYRAYDLWLLQIIHDHPRQAQEILQQLFSNNSIDEVFRFLGEENTLLQDIKTISRFSYSPFLRAIWKTKKRLFEI